MPHLSSYCSANDKQLELDMTKLRSMHNSEAQLRSLPSLHICYSNAYYTVKRSDCYSLL